MEPDFFTDFMGRFFLASMFLYASTRDLGHYSLSLQRLREKSVPFPEVLHLLFIGVRFFGSASLISNIAVEIFAPLLVVFMGGMAYYFQAFWKETEEPAKIELINQFLMSIAVIGGLLILIARV